MGGDRLTVLNVAYPFAPVSADSAGGAEQVLGTLDRALAGAGHHSIVVACRGSCTAGTVLTFPAVAGTIDADAKRTTYKAVKDTLSLASQRHAIDLIHYHGVDFAEYVHTAEIPSLVTLHLPPSWYRREDLTQNAGNIWFNCVSATQQAALDAIIADRQRVLPPILNGIDVGAFSVRLASRRNFVLALGRICHEKGQHVAIAAAKMAGVPLIIAGALFRYPDHQKYFETKIFPHLGSLVRWIGAAGFNRKRRLLSAAKCVLIPSIAPETSSLVAMEAIASGTPVIAFRSGALPEIIEHGKTGFIVGSAAEMAEAIHAVGTINASTCKSAAASRFSAKNMIDGYMAAYHQLAAMRVR